MNTAVIYTRVSTDKQAREGISLEGQLEACRKYAVDKDLEIARIFTDAGASAKTAERPQFLEMLDFCHTNRGKIKELIVWKLDRFSRNSYDHIVIGKKLRDYGIKLASVTEIIDETPMGRMLEGIISTFNQFENDVRAERTKSGMTKRIQQGGWTHVAPLGYKNSKDSLGRPTLTIDTTSAPAVKDLLTAISEKQLRPAKLVNLANSLGVKNRRGKSLSIQNIYKMAKNPLYAGLVKSSLSGEVIKGLHTPLISVETFAQNQQVLLGKRSGLEHKKISEDWPLRNGFIKCADCKSPLTGSTPSGRNKRYSYYSCIHCRRSVTGKSVNESKDLVHEKFIELLEEIKPTDTAVKMFKEMAIKKWAAEYKATLVMMRNTSEELQRLEEKKQKVLDKFVDDQININEKRTLLEGVDRDIVNKRIIRSQLDSEIVNKDNVIDIFTELIANPSRSWQMASVNIKQVLQKTYFPEGVEYKFGEGFRTPKLDVAFEVMIEAGDKSSTMVIPRGIEPLLPG